MVKLCIQNGYKSFPLSKQELELIELALKQLRTDFMRHKGLTSEDDYYINLCCLLAKLKII